MVANRFKRNFDAIAVAVVAGLILTGILAVIPELRGFSVKALLWAWRCVTLVWAMLDMKYPVPGWVILIGGLWVIVDLWRLSVSRWFRAKPVHKNYTEDMIDGALWRWSWNGSTPVSLACFCPSCDAELVTDYKQLGHETNFICERCPCDERSAQYRMPC